MGWPDRPDNWRNGARPAQRAYADVANAVSVFEPVIVYANSGQVDPLSHNPTYLPHAIGLADML